MISKGATLVCPQCRNRLATLKTDLVEGTVIRLSLLEDLTGLLVAGAYLCLCPVCYAKLGDSWKEWASRFELPAKTEQDSQHDQVLQFALAQLRKIKTEAETEKCPGKIRLEYLYNAAGEVFITRAEVKFEPVVRLSLTADMKLAWLDE